jgi:hypothetical protein
MQDEIAEERRMAGMAREMPEKLVFSNTGSRFIFGA